MEILDVQQGSQDWRELRAASCNASEAPAMMGVDPNVRRSELLHMKATGTEREFSDWVQKNILDHGHAVEEAARPIAEEIIGEDLYRVTGRESVQDLSLLASCDGLTMLGDIVWEHKQWAVERANAVREGLIPEEHIWQLEHQLLVTGAEVALFMVSDGTEENCFHAWYYPNEERREKLIRGWQQFLADLAEHTVKEQPQEAVANPQATLPTPAVQVQGEVAVTGNLHEFGEALQAYVERVNLQPQDDQEFADLEAAAKALKKAEDALTAAEEQALAQTASIQDMRQAIQEYRETARQTRLQAEKAVKSEKENRKAQIRDGAVDALRAHYEQISATLDGMTLAAPATFGHEVAEAMKNKRTIASLQDAADTALSHAKIAANEKADRARAVLKQIHELPEEYRGLFRDLEHLAGMDPEAATATIQSRVADEKARLDAIREEERRKAEEDAQRKAIKEERRRAEEKRKADEKREDAHAPEQAAEPEPAPQKTFTEAPKGPESAAEEGRPVKVNVFLNAPAGWTDEQVRQEVERRLSDLNPSVAVRRQEDAE